MENDDLLTFFFSLRQSFKREDRIESCWQKDSGIDHSGPFTQNAWLCSSAQWQNKPRKKETTSRQEGASSGPGMATGRYGSRFVTLKHSSCRETSHGAEVRRGWGGTHEVYPEARAESQASCQRALWVGLQVRKQGEGQTGKHLLWTEPWTDEEQGQRSPGMCSLT